MVMTLFIPIFLLMMKKIMKNRVQTPSHYESTDDEESDEGTHGVNVVGEELDEEETKKEDEANELYRDVNVNLEGRDTKMTHAPRTIIQPTQEIEDTHVIITMVNPEGQQQNSFVSSGFVSSMFNPSPDTGIDSIFNLNTESTSLVDVLVTTIAKTPLLFATTLPSPTIPLITHLQQTSSPTLTTVLSSSLQDLPNFGSLFGFDHKLKTLETDFSEFKQTNQFVAVFDRLRDEAQAENADFINKLDDNIKKIIKDQVKEQVKAQVSKILPKIEKTVNEQLKAEVLTHSSNESKTSHAVAANLSEPKLKKIRIDKMESNKRRDEEDKDEEPSARSNRGSKRRRVGKEPESTSTPKEKTSKSTGKSTEGSKSFQKSDDESAQADEPMQTAKDLEEPAHQEFETGVTKDQPDEETSQLPDDNDKLYTFKEVDFNRLRIQDIEDMLLLLVQGKCVEDLQLGVESYQKKLNLTKPDTYISDLKRREAYTSYSNPRGFIYQNKDKKNRLMRIDELHKFSDGTLNDVQTALDDRLKGIRMKYLPQTI
ncbi:hypothetical protein Tco_1392827 [Tanacetum coccineum]